MYKFIKISIVVLILLPSVCFADFTTIFKSFSAGKDSVGFFLEGGGNPDPDVATLRFGLIGNNGWYTSMIGFEILDEAGHYSGVTAGVRAQFPSMISPFVGVHVFAGISDKEFDATKDGEDNDNDGTVDEEDEEHYDSYDSIVAICPEVGLMYNLNKRFQFLLSAKYYFTDRGSEHEYMIYSFGVKALFF